MARHPVIAVTPQQNAAEVCLSCHTPDGLSEVRIGNSLTTLCFGCLGLIFEKGGFFATQTYELKQAKEEIAYLERLRPHWAKGFTRDGVAAQTYLAAMQQMHEKLGVDNQTAAIQKLEALLK